MCCTRVAENTGRKKSPKNRHLGTMAQLRRAVSSQLRHVLTIGKKRVFCVLVHKTIRTFYGKIFNRPTENCVFTSRPPYRRSDRRPWHAEVQAKACTSANERL